MPCRDNEPDRSADAVQGRLDNVTKLLCELCQTMEDRVEMGPVHDVNGLPEWFDRHKELDRQREENEKGPLSLN